MKLILKTNKINVNTNRDIPRDVAGQIELPYTPILTAGP